MGGKTVTADAQFGIARILKPFANFTTVYQGQPATRQIVFSEATTPSSGSPIDQLAANGVPGYDPNLVKGLAVPFGARVVIWLPVIQPTNITPATNYNWALAWRLRNVFDYRQNRTPYHFPKQGSGIADTSSGTPSPRVVIPAAWQTIVYTQEPQPADASSTVTSNGRVENVATAFGGFPGVTLGQPFTPSGAGGAIQQGIFNPGTSGVSLAAMPSFEVFEYQAVGDELVILLWRPSGPANWDFAVPLVSPDSILAQAFSNQFVNNTGPDYGVYVMVGSAP